VWPQAEIAENPPKKQMAENANLKKMGSAIPQEESPPGTPRCPAIDRWPWPPGGGL